MKVRQIVCIREYRRHFILFWAGRSLHSFVTNSNGGYVFFQMRQVAAMAGIEETLHTHLYQMYFENVGTRNELLESLGNFVQYISVKHLGHLHHSHTKFCGFSINFLEKIIQLQNPNMYIYVSHLYIKNREADIPSGSFWNLLLLLLFCVGI